MDNATWWSTNLTEERPGNASPDLCTTPVCLVLTSLEWLVLCLGILTNSGFIFTFVRISSIRTTTNYCLLNLAVADLLYVLSETIFHVMSRMQDDPDSVPLQCTFHWLLTVASSQCGFFTVCIVSVDRYLIICKTRSKQIWSKQRAVYALAAAWLLAGVASIPFVLGCSEHDRILETFTNVFDAFVILAPLSVVVTLYTMIARKLSQHEEALSKWQRNKRTGTVQATRMLVITTAISFMCVIPYTVYVILSSSHVGNINPEDSRTLRQIFELLLMVNSAINPILYISLSTQHRRALKKALTLSNKSSKTSTTGKWISESRQVMHVPLTINVSRQVECSS